MEQAELRHYFSNERAVKHNFRPVRKKGNYWAYHVGLGVFGSNGERHLFQLSKPVMQEESFESFITSATERETRQAVNGKPGKVLAGFSF